MIKQIINKGEQTEFVVVCPNCGKEYNPCPKCVGSTSGYEAYKNDALIQNAFPELPPEERELLISGICNDCWNEMFSDEED